MDWTSDKDKQAEKLRAENDKLRRLCDEFIESAHDLNVQVMELQRENDELIADNKSNHNVGVEYRDSAQRLSVQVEDLQSQVTTRNKDIVALKNRVKSLESAIIKAFEQIDSA